MSTDKENIVIYASILTFLFLVVCSMLVKFNIYDFLYVIFAIYAIIRYIMLSRKN